MPSDESFLSLILMFTKVVLKLNIPSEERFPTSLLMFTKVVVNLNVAKAFHD